MKEEVKTKRENGKTFVFSTCGRCGKTFWRRKDYLKKTDMCRSCAVISRNLTHG